MILRWRAKLFFAYRTLTSSPKLAAAPTAEEASASK
jgi:hypothetical protein